jgi:hypothetical protein
VADAAALAAARELNGTPAGITKAVAEAEKRVTDEDDGISYQYGRDVRSWSDAALMFGSSPDPGRQVVRRNGRRRSCEGGQVAIREG